MKIKSVLFFLLLSALISCNKYSRTHYPQSATLSPNYIEINRYHQLRIDSLHRVPQNIQKKLIMHLKNRMGEEKFSKLVFESTYIWSDQPIPIGPPRSLTEAVLYGNDSFTKAVGTEIDTIYKYPLFSSNFQFSVPDKGIELIDLNIILDNEGEIIKDIMFPNNGFDNFIPIDSIHSELIRRKISNDKLNIYLSYSEKTNKYYWSTNTLIRPGSIFGPSCFPEVQHHFKMNAFTGVITEYNYEGIDGYLEDIF